MNFLYQVRSYESNKFSLTGKSHAKSKNRKMGGNHRDIKRKKCATDK